MILIYAFSNRWGTNISTRTLIDLQDEYKNYTNIIFQKIISHPRSFFNEFIHNKLYTVIIGLGDFYYAFDKIRIEAQAQNLYGRHSIIPNASPTIDLDLPILDHIDPTQFIVTHNMGSANCNWIAYQTQSYINQKSLTCYHLFFHLPPKSNSLSLATNIKTLLSTNQII